MKKHLILTIAVTATLMLTINVYAGFGGGRGAGTGGMMGGGMRGGGMRGGRGGFNIESISAVVTAIEEQLTKIKGILAEAAEQTAGAASAAGGRGAGGIDFQAMMQAQQERTTAVQQAASVIADQVVVLDSTPLQTEITELQAALTKANEEEATETAELIQAMITTRQEKAQTLGIRIRGGQRGARGERGAMSRGMMGGRGGRTPAPEGGFEWTD